MIKLILLICFSLFNLYLSNPVLINFSNNSPFFTESHYCSTENTSPNEQKSTIKSPVNIEYYNCGGTMVFPGNPQFVLDRTFYKRVNGVKFEFRNKEVDNVSQYKDLEMNISGIGYAYVKLYNKTHIYNPDKLRLRVFSEHTFE